MDETRFDRRLGIATYRAEWIGKSLLVRLTATGVMPCYNYEAMLEQHPARVLPPMWNMVFLTQDFCLTAMKPFEHSVIFPSFNASSVIIHDAAGSHEVPIVHATDPARIRLSISGDRDTGERHVVFARLPPPAEGEGHSGCFVAPEGTIVTAIHYVAFGPASAQDCAAYVAANCSKPTKDDENTIPWPWVRSSGDFAPWPWSEL